MPVLPSVQSDGMRLPTRIGSCGRSSSAIRAPAVSLPVYRSMAPWSGMTKKVTTLEFYGRTLSSQSSLGGLIEAPAAAYLFEAPLAKWARAAASKESAMVADGFFNPVFYFSHSSTNSPSHPESSPGSSRTHHQRWEVRVLEILNRAAAGEHPN